jgi:PAS domain S-box-containing protein
MTAHFSQPRKPQALRTRAEGKLKDGSAQPTHGWLTSLDALSLLYKLASSPGSAGDALKLLHELQVHQVELDLQHEQLEASERELTEDLIHCARLYDFAPVSYFSVSPDGKINRVNVAGAALCGEDRAELIGRRIDDFLTPESRPVLDKLVAQLRNGARDETCEVRTTAGTAFHVTAGLVPGEASILMVFVDLADSIKPARSA